MACISATRPVLGHYLNVPVELRLPVTVITFEPQPREYFTPEQCRRA